MIAGVLQRNSDTYELAGVQIVAKALWKCETEIAFEREGALSGRIRETGKNTPVIPVSTCRLADFLNEPVDLLKLDIEGAETEVLLTPPGASTTWKTSLWNTIPSWANLKI